PRDGANPLGPGEGRRQATDGYRVGGRRCRLHGAAGLLRLSRPFRVTGAAPGLLRGETIGGVVIEAICQRLEDIVGASRRLYDTIACGDAGGLSDLQKAGLLIELDEYASKLEALAEELEEKLDTENGELAE